MALQSPADKKGKDKRGSKREKRMQNDLGLNFYRQPMPFEADQQNTLDNNFGQNNIFTQLNVQRGHTNIISTYYCSI